MQQEPTLFARSIKRNILYGLEGTDREPTDDDVKEAARLANASSFIEVSISSDPASLKPTHELTSLPTDATEHASEVRH